MRGAQRCYGVDKGDALSLANSAFAQAELQGCCRLRQAQPETGVGLIIKRLSISRSQCLEFTIQILLYGKESKLCAIGKTQFAEQVAHMRTHSCDADAERLSNLGICLPLRHQL